MSEETRDLLVRGVAAARGNSKEESRHYLKWVVDAPDAEPDEILTAWRTLAEIADDPKEKRECLMQALAYDPSDPEARRALALLDGRVQARELVDPDHLSAGESQPSALSRRYVCTRCGGTMSFAPDSGALTCDYCGIKQYLANLDENHVVLAEQDFAVALATKKGHSFPKIASTIKCLGCGASFVLPASIISSSCAYCGSPYVAEHVESRELIEPEGVLAFKLDRDSALQKLLDWFHSEKLSLKGEPVPPIGLYFPAWTFDVSGEIEWHCMQEENGIWLPASGSRVVFENDLLVAASHALSHTLTDEINAYPLDRMTRYDPRYLVDWAAETYQISVSDASLVARSRIMDREKQAIQETIYKTYKDLQYSSSHLVVESYKLVLLPVWIGHYRMGGKQYSVVINGDTGSLHAEKSIRGIRGIFQV